MRFNSDCGFDTFKHAYTYKWSPLLSVTKYLNLIGKELTQWGANMAVEYLMNKTRIWENDFEEARKHWSTVMNDSAKLGSNVHNAIEHYIRTKEVISDHPCFHAFMKFKDTVNILETEVKIVNPELNYAGTLDVIYERDGKKFLGDFKTGNGIYGTTLLQLSAYAIALDGEKIDGIAIIHIKKDGTCEVVECEDYSEYVEAFIGITKIYPTIKKAESVVWGKEKHRLKFNVKTYVL